MIKTEILWWCLTGSFPSYIHIHTRTHTHIHTHTHARTLCHHLCISLHTGMMVVYRATCGRRWVWVLYISTVLLYWVDNDVFIPPLFSAGKSLWKLFLEQFDDLLIKILLVAAVISFVSCKHDLPPSLSLSFSLSVSISLCLSLSVSVSLSPPPSYVLLYAVSMEAVLGSGREVKRGQENS